MDQKSRTLKTCKFNRNIIRPLRKLNIDFPSNHEDKRIIIPFVEKLIVWVLLGIKKRCLFKIFFLKIFFDLPGLCLCASIIVPYITYYVIFVALFWFLICWILSRNYRHPEEVFISYCSLTPTSVFQCLVLKILKT